jgi:hypothetical protein
MEGLLYAEPQKKQLRLLRVKFKELRAHIPEAEAPPTSHKNARLDLQGAVAEIRRSLAEVKRARKENAARNRKPLRALDAERLQQIRDAQSKSALYWANRIEIRSRYDTARARAIRSGEYLRTRLWDGTGAVTVYFQRGLPVRSLFGRNGRLQVDPVPESAWRSPSRATRRRLSRARVRMRISANADGTPVWLELPLIMHRPLPEGGIIRWASIVRERVGLSWRHRLLLTVREPLPVRNEIHNAVGIVLGWRLLPGGLRVACWCGEDGHQGELLLTQRDLAAFRQLDSLKAAIATAHSGIRSSLRSFFDTHTVPATWRSSAQEGIDAESPRKMASFFERWQAERFSGDSDVFAAVQSWYKQHVHLWTWQANLRDQLLRRRRELYRRFAADIARRHNRVFVNDLPLASLARKSAAGQAGEAGESQHRFIASVSILLKILISACEKNGVAVTRVDVGDLAKPCHACGALDESGRAISLTQTCSRCGATCDWDYNVALNLLRKMR